MSFAPVIAATAFQAAAAAVQDGRPHGHYAPPDPDRLGAPFEFVDTRGRTVRSADLLGRWVLLYFGYARCTASCSTAVPMLAEAGRELRRRGVPATPVFVDIDAPPGAVMRLRSSGGGKAHAAHGSQELRALADRYPGDLLVLTGDRRQLAAAAIAFQVNREHTPPRPGEAGHSINHSSLVYLIAPDGKVAGYADSDVAPAQLANSVQSLHAAS